MNRRQFISGAGVFLAAPWASDAQPTKVPRIGFLSAGSRSAPASRHNRDVFRQGLRDLGYVEGQSLAFEERWADGRYERLPELAAELVRLNVDILVTVATPATRAAQQATRSIPIVMTLVSDPVESGLVANLAHPVGNTTGLSLMHPELSTKRLELALKIPPAVLARADQIIE